MVVSMQRFNVSGCQKMVSETNCYLSKTIECLTFDVDVNVGVKNYNFKFPYIMIVKQKLKLMQEFTSAINVQCLHSSL